MPVSRLGGRIATALQDQKVTPDEARELIETAKAEPKWTPARKAELQSVLANPTTVFEGTARADLQAFVATQPVQADLADPAVLDKNLTDLSWNPVDGGRLYVDDISYDDVAQGSIGDCFLAGGLSAVANANPDLVRNAVTDHGDGTYSVRFFQSQGQGQPMSQVSVTVDGDVPARSAGSRSVYAHARESTELWPTLVEKAYAQWKGGYEVIGKGGVPGDLITSLTGRPTRYLPTTTSSADQLFSQIQTGASSRAPMAAVTYGEDQSALYTNTGVHAWHTYTVLGASEDSGQKYVELRNPWGYSEPSGDGNDDGSFKLPLADFMKLYRGLTVGQ